jgi:hypothetical protein
VLREADPAHSLRFTQATREEFFATGAGAGDLMRAADAMLCSHPVGMCELAMPFNRTAVVWATTRFDLGREGNRTRLAGLVGNLRALALGPGLVAVANNLYDVHYLNYFTGAMPALLPSLGAYAPAAARWQWDGVEDRVLVWGFRPGGAVAAEFLNQLEAAAPGLGFEHARDVYPGEFDMADLASHPAILHAPYQASSTAHLGGMVVSDRCTRPWFTHRHTIYVLVHKSSSHAHPYFRHTAIVTHVPLAISFLRSGIGEVPSK